MTDPAPGRAVTTDVRKTSLGVTIRSTKRHFLYCLIHYQTLNTQPANSTTTSAAAAAAAAAAVAVVAVVEVFISSCYNV